MRIGKFKKLLVSILVLSLSFGMMNVPRVVNAEGGDNSESIERIDRDGLETSKTISYDTIEKKYKVSLESYVTGTVSDGEPMPADIVLVLDVSGSMSNNFSTDTTYALISSKKNSEVYNNRNNLYYFDGDNYQKIVVERIGYYGNYTYNYNINDEILVSSGANNLIPDQLQGKLYTSSQDRVSRLQALKNAANNFIDSVYNESIKNNVDHRISIITFSTKANTKSSLLSVKEYVDTLHSNINNLRADGSTYVDEGLKKANNEMKNINRESSRVTILFTDGYPGYYTDQFDPNVANDAIYQSYMLKNTYKSTVYSIGIFPGADNSQISSLNGSTLNNNANKYLNFVSSNYPNAKSMLDYGDVSYPDNPDGTKGNYYLTANDTTSLNNVFQTISDNISEASIILDETTVLKDILSNYFKFPKDFTKNDVDVYTSNAIDQDGNGNYIFSEEKVQLNTDVEVDLASKTVSVKGFNYSSSENFVAKNESTGKIQGKKLIVEFYIEPIDGFIGGNGVPTNDPNSGIYDKNGHIVEHFERPITDVALNYYFGTQNTGIYITDDWTNFKYLINEFNYTTSKTSEEYDYSLGDDYVNDFVDVVYTIKEGNKIIGTLTVPASTDAQDLTNCIWHPNSNFSTKNITDDVKKYTIEVSVNTTIDRTTTDEIPSNNIQNSENQNSKAKLYIFKPTVESHDLDEVLLGSTINNLGNQIQDKNEWKCYDSDNVTISIINEESIKPTLQFKVNPNDGNGSENQYTTTDLGYNEMVYRVYANDIEITSQTKAIHKNELNQCEDENQCISKHFYINVVGGTISFNKFIANMENYPIKEDGIFVYKITNDSTHKIYYRIVRMQYNEETKSFTCNKIDDLINLPAGSYTVKELSSMRFTCDGYSRRIDSNEYIEGDEVKVIIDENSRNAYVSFKNSLTYDDNLSDGDVVVNSFKKNDDGSISITQDWLDGKKIIDGETEGGQ